VILSINWTNFFLINAGEASSFENGNEQWVGGYFFTNVVTVSFSRMTLEHGVRNTQQMLFVYEVGTIQFAFHIIMSYITDRQALPSHMSLEAFVTPGPNSFMVAMNH
jgi:hypothetical protein